MRAAVDWTKGLVAILLTVLAIILLGMSFAVLWDAADQYAYALAKLIKEIV